MSESNRRTGEVAQALSHRLGRQVTEAQINALLRRHPSMSPPIVAGRRAWRERDVDSLVHAMREGQVGRRA